MFCITIGNMTVKISANLDASLVAFLQQYQEQHQLKTRSSALEAALRELQRSHLRAEYASAAQDPDYLADVAAWDGTIADGLDEAY
jgi:Arc/MetJ-type ribon-helix-helix transcriptional regulator